MIATFSLLEEPWIPCRMLDGSGRELGLRETLARAHEIAEVRDASPLVTSATFRLLLCFLHRILGGPRSSEDWLRVWERGAFDPELLDRYFAHWSDRFDLFHPHHPFGQIAGFHTLKAGKPADPKPLSAMVHDLATANNTTLFDHSLDDEPEPRSPAWCARQLLAALAWSLGGGIQPTSNLGPHPNARHAPLAGKLQVFLQRGTLFESLVANLLIVTRLPDWCQGTEDRPAWERDAPRPVVDTPTWPQGLTDYLSFPSRYLCFLPVEEAGVVVVRHVYLAQGLFLPPEVQDPYACYRSSDQYGVLPVSFSADRDLWRDSAALYAWEGEGATSNRMDGRPRAMVQADSDDLFEVLGDRTVLALRVFALASDQAKPLAWGTFDLPLPARMLRDPYLAGILRSTLERIGGAGRCLRSSFERLARSLLETDQKPADAKEVGRIRDHLLGVSDFWSRAGTGFEPFMRALGEDPLVAQSAWLDLTRRAAEAAFDDACRSLPGRPVDRLHAEVSVSAWFRAGLRQELEA